MGKGKGHAVGGQRWVLCHGWVPSLTLVHCWVRMAVPESHHLWLWGLLYCIHH